MRKKCCNYAEYDMIVGMFSKNALGGRLKRSLLTRYCGYSRALAHTMQFINCMVFFCSTIGCVVPQDLEVQSEGNTRPKILSDGTTPELGKKFTEFRTESLSPTLNKEYFTVVIREPDEQTLKIRVFLNGDYTKLIQISQDTLPYSPEISEEDRAIPFYIEGLCDEGAPKTDDGPHVLEIYVSDEGFLDGAADLREPGPYGLRDNALWRFGCEDPVVLPSDGGI